MSLYIRVHVKMTPSTRKALTQRAGVLLELLDHVLELRELFVDGVNSLELVVNRIR